MQEPFHLILAGFMGTGKSASGAIAAEQLGLPLYEMDAMLEERFGKTISEVFADEGEVYFRDAESRLAQDVVSLPSGVVATGGGIVTRKANTDALEQAGLLVCLRASPDVVLQRVAGTDHRPLLDDPDKAGRIRALLAERAPLYDALPHQVDTDGRSPADVAEELVTLYRSARES